MQHDGHQPVPERPVRSCAMSAKSATVARVASRFDASRGRIDGRVVSIVLAVFDPPVDALSAQLDAIAGQTSDRWECVVVDDASTMPEIRELLDSWVAGFDRRTLIRRPTNGGIAAATNDGLDATTGDIITICDHDDIIHPGAVDAIIAHFDAHPGDDIVYTDEELISASGLQLAEYRKPDYSPRRHLGHHYLAHLVAVRRSALEDLRVRREFEPAQDYDFYLRVIERAVGRGKSVGHIPEILYSWRAIEGSSARDAADKPEMADAVRRCVQDALGRRGVAATAVTIEHAGKPTTSVRLTRDTPDQPSVTVLELGPESSPAELNASVAASGDEVIVFSPDPSRFGIEWATPLIADAIQRDVGAVGPLIVRASEHTETQPKDVATILSVGRTVAGVLDDPFTGLSADNPGLWGAFFVAREVTALAPAGLVVQRSAFESVGGLATDVGLDVAVAELCVRLEQLGRATIWNPAAVLKIDLPGEATALLDVEFSGDAGRARLDDELTVAAQRIPAIRAERLATTGVLPSLLVAPNAYSAARRLIVAGAVQLVTCDVFDTIVTRPVATPSDLFAELGRQLIADGLLPPDVSPATFATARSEAEHRARIAVARATRSTLRASTPRPTDEEISRATATVECTLDEIWARMPWTHVADRDALIARELDVEAEALRPIPEAVELLRVAAERSIPVVLVSDIYLHADQLRGVLDRVGFDLDLVDEIVTSADHRLGKAQGLLARVIDDRRVDRQAVLHIGDNLHADVRTATDLGALPIHVDIARLDHVTKTPHPALQAWSRAEGSDLGISAAVRSTLVKAAGRGLDPSFQYGAAVIGPALAGFSRWVSTTAQDLGATHVHCMLREGATIAQLMGLTAPDGPTPRTIHVSRWVTMRAAVIDATPDELITALARRADLSVDHVVQAFGCDATLVRDVLGTDLVAANQLSEACERIADNDNLREQIVRSAASLRRRTLLYLRERLVIGNGPLVVADVGWGGTIQEGLQRILRSDGIDNEVVGLYFALSAPGEARVAAGATMLSYLPNAFDDPDASVFSRTVSHHADTVERIMTPEIGTLIDIDERGAPVTRPVTDDRLPPSLLTAQRGVREVVQRLTDTALGLSDLEDPRWGDMGLRRALACSIADTVATPSQPLAVALGSWPHDDVAGAAHRSIAGGDDSILFRYANARDLDLEPGRNWVAGTAAAENPTLAAQLAAQRAGIPLTSLCPDSENGVGRLAAFAIGSDLAAVQVGRVVAVSPSGWSVLRIAGPVDSLRSIRFDAGEHDALVEIGEFAVDCQLGPESSEHGAPRISAAISSSAASSSSAAPPSPATQASAASGSLWSRSVSDVTAPDLVWVEAHPLDRNHFTHRGGGHLIVPIDPSVGARCSSVTATVAFRVWRLDPGSPLAVAPLTHRIGAQGRRIVRNVQRRLPK
jgi:FMN phosphatase YigB (HAD superfamily)